mmetsp:Transcript_29423/g.89313  ORF Transcript_29423/g.89313 Transcript_29423/m.89313 type:complete len:758 (-) Transcript_29423:1533-3806(-)
MRGPQGLRRASRARLRHRVRQAAAKVPGRDDRPGDDDLVHGRRAGLPHHQPRDRVGGHRVLRVHAQARVPGALPGLQREGRGRHAAPLRAAHPAAQAAHRRHVQRRQLRFPVRQEALRGARHRPQRRDRLRHLRGRQRRVLRLALDHAHRLHPLGEAGLVPPRRLARPQGGVPRQARVRAARDRPRRHDALRHRGPAQDGAVLGLGRRGHLLPLHEVRLRLHLLPLHHHPDVARRGAAKGVGHALRVAPHGGGVPRERHLPKQAGRRRDGGARRPLARVGDVRRRPRRVPADWHLPKRHQGQVAARPRGVPGAAGPAARHAQVRDRDRRQGAALRGDKLRRGVRGDRAPTPRAARPAQPARGAAHLPPRRLRHVPQHHPHQPTAAARHRHRGDVRQLRAQPARVRLQAAARMDVARRDLPRLARRVEQHPAAARARVLPRPRGGRAALVGRARKVRAEHALPRAPQGVLPKGVQEDAHYQAAAQDGRHVPAREPVLHRHRQGVPRPAVRVQGEEQGVEQAARAGGGRRRRGRASRVQGDVHAVRLAAARPQVHPQLVLRLRDAARRAVVLDGDGGGGDVHGRRHHQGGARPRRKDRQDPRARHGRHLVRAARLLPAERRRHDEERQEAEGCHLLPVRHAQRRRRPQQPQPAVPDAQPRDWRLRQAAGDVDRVRGGRPLQGHDPARVDGGGAAAQEAVRRLRAQRRPRRAQGLRGEAARGAAAAQGLPDADLLRGRFPRGVDARGVLRVGGKGGGPLA